MWSRLEWGLSSAERKIHFQSIIFTVAHHFFPPMNIHVIRTPITQEALFSLFPNWTTHAFICPDADKCTQDAWHQLSLTLALHSQWFFLEVNGKLATRPFVRLYVWKGHENEKKTMDSTTPTMLILRGWRSGFNCNTHVWLFSVRKKTLTFRQEETMAEVGLWNLYEGVINTNIWAHRLCRAEAKTTKGTTRIRPDIDKLFMQTVWAPLTPTLHRTD